MSAYIAQLFPFFLFFSADRGDYRHAWSARSQQHADPESQRGPEEEAVDSAGARQ